MRNDRESQGINVPGPRVAQYYGDRASAGGLQISEATDICFNASAYPGCPGVFTPSQLEGWRKVTDAVHAKGGFIFAQLWHTGRASSAGLRGGEAPVSSGTIPMNGSYLDGTACKDEPPRAMTVEEIHEMTKEWAAAAKRAVDEAGFDGVEIHSEFCRKLICGIRNTNYVQAPTATFSSNSSTTTSTSVPTNSVAQSRTAADSP